MHWVLTDLNLAGTMDGLQLVAKIRAEAPPREGLPSGGPERRWPVISVLSGDSEEHTRYSCTQVRLALMRAFPLQH